MSSVNIHEAKTQLSRLLARVAAGEEIIITKAGKPLARLVPLERCPARRTGGTLADQIRIAEDFDNPLPDDLLRDFER